MRSNDMDEDFPQFKRSPRIIKREPTDKVEVKDPPAKPEKKKGAWMTILMPLVMVCVTVALGVFMKRGWMVLMSATMMMASAAFAVVRIVNEKKDTKEKLKNRERDYQEYLLHIRKCLHGLFQAQKESRLYHNPDVPEIEKMVREHSGRIYEHASNDADFLCVSLSVYLKNLFSYEKSEKKRAGECRQLFSGKAFSSFEIKEIEERACSLTRILVQADWDANGKHYSEPLEFGCMYQDEDEKPALPWRENGAWCLIPWKVQGLYKN